MPNKNTLDFWNSAHWLSNAPEKFAEAAYPDEWANAVEIRGNRHSLTAMFEAVQENLAPGKSFSEVMQDASRAENQRHKLTTELIDRAKIEIIHRAKKGQFVGFGFDRPRLIETSPVQIPVDAWYSYIGWHKNSITYQSLKLIDIRLDMSGQFQSKAVGALEMLSPKQAPMNHKRPSRGRPTVKTEVEQAFHALNAESRINTEHSSKSHYPLIREWLTENSTDLSVPPATMSDETIRRITAPLFKALKENQ